MFNHQEIEKKWQKFWEENKTFQVENTSTKPKFYALDMFPYPSGTGLHVGHPVGYTANDIITRYKHANGYHVLHPMGWDAFGLPAENYAIKTGIHPKIITKKNVDTFRAQIKTLGISYDWSREVDTTDPKYYKWTQWIFAKMFEAGLAYEQDLPINFCPSCKTGLANEEVMADGTCERCGYPVEKRQIRQWVLAITKYADRLAADVEDLDWPEGIKDMQRKWIGRSEGCEFEMKKDGDDTKSIRVYTTRVDTVFGMSYAVIAPDHECVDDFITSDQEIVCREYIDAVKNKSDLERTSKEKSGVFSGSYVINPFNDERVPLWIGDYVLGNYGTGAVMAVPAHDERDFAFAKQYDLPIKQVIEGKDLPFTDDGIVINSQDFDGLSSAETRVKLTQHATEKGFGEKKINYKLRDWLFSRQRYWGEPIPLIHLKKEDVRALPRIYSLDDTMESGKAYVLKTEPNCVMDERVLCSRGQIKDLVIDGKIVSRIYAGLYSDIIIDWELPLELPDVEKYEPSGDGRSPLASIDDFVQVQLADNLAGERETNTMPQWGGSCWYYLRYMDPHNDRELVNPEVEKYWGSVDSYVGGAEHAVLHLLYARFWHKFLYDIGVVSTKEPFTRLRNQGMIQAYAYQTSRGQLIANDLVVEKDGKYFHRDTGESLEQVVAKMSKSLKNVVNPDDIVREYGADTLRLYEMYMGEFKDSKAWDTQSILGVRRFLERSYNLFTKGKIGQDDNESMKLLHETIKKVSNDIEEYKFNTALAQMMILVNYGTPKDQILQKEWKNIFARLLHPFAPHLAEELWEMLGNTESIYFTSWPKYDESMLISDTMTLPIQVLGKVRGELEIDVNTSKEEILTQAKLLESVTKWLDGREIVKEVYVPGKIVNFVVK